MLICFPSRDAFAGGFVAGIVEGKPLDECVDMGQWLAKLSIQELGPQYVTLILMPPPPSILPHSNYPIEKKSFKTTLHYQIPGLLSSFGFPPNYILGGETLSPWVP